MLPVAPAVIGALSGGWRAAAVEATTQRRQRLTTQMGQRGYCCPRSRCFGAHLFYVAPFRRLDVVAELGHLHSCHRPSYAVAFPALTGRDLVVAERSGAAACRGR